MLSAAMRMIPVAAAAFAPEDVVVALQLKLRSHSPAKRYEVRSVEPFLSNAATTQTDKSDRWYGKKLPEGMHVRYEFAISLNGVPMTTKHTRFNDMYKCNERLRRMDRELMHEFPVLKKTFNTGKTNRDWINERADKLSEWLGVALSKIAEHDEHGQQPQEQPQVIDVLRQFIGQLGKGDEGVRNPIDIVSEKGSAVNSNALKNRPVHAAPQAVARHADERTISRADSMQQRRGLTEEERERLDAVDEAMKQHREQAWMNEQDDRSRVAIAKTLHDAEKKSRTHATEKKFKTKSQKAREDLLQRVQEMDSIAELNLLDHKASNQGFSDLEKQPLLPAHRDEIRKAITRRIEQLQNDAVNNAPDTVINAPDAVIVSTREQRAENARRTARCSSQSSLPKFECSNQQTGDLKFQAYFPDGRKPEGLTEETSLESSIMDNAVGVFVSEILESCKDERMRRGYYVSFFDEACKPQGGWGSTFAKKREQLGEMARNGGFRYHASLCPALKPNMIMDFKDKRKNSAQETAHETLPIGTSIVVNNHKLQQRDYSSIPRSEQYYSLSKTAAGVVTDRACNDGYVEVKWSSGATQRKKGGVCKKQYGAPVSDLVCCVPRSAVRRNKKAD